MVADGNAQRNQLTSSGLSPTIAAPCLSAEDFQPDAPFRSPLGIPPPLVGDADQLARSFALLDGFLEQLDQRFDGTLVGLNDGRQQGLNVSDLLLQEGNLTLWRFRQGALRLFAEQASLFALAEPQNPAQPELVAFQAAARVDLDVLRGWMLFQKYRASQPVLIDQAVFMALLQGHWQVVLNGWSTGQRLSLEQIQAERSYLNTLGERYDAQAVQTAVREAEWYFREALCRQPTQSVALVNLAALLAESALLTYIETGTADRTRLQQARDLFRRAHNLLDQRSDQEGKVALAQCLLYEAISLPPEARLEIVQWASSQAQQLRATLGPDAPGSVRWDIAQRNLARRDPSFFDWEKIGQARDILVSVGSMAILGTLAQQWLGMHAHMSAASQGGLQAGAGYHPTPEHVEHPGGSVAGATHAAPSGEQSASQALRQVSAKGSADHAATTTRVASHDITHKLRHLLSTVAGKIIAVAVVTTVVVAGVAGVALTHHTVVNIVGDWNVTYGAPAVVTISGSGGAYTETAKSPVRVTGSSCYLAPGTIIATFSGLGTSYTGQHGLWYVNNCSFARWVSLRLTLNGNTLKGVFGDGGTVIFTRVISGS